MLVLARGIVFTAYGCDFVLASLIVIVALVHMSLNIFESSNCISSHISKYLLLLVITFQMHCFLYIFLYVLIYDCSKVKKIKLSSIIVKLLQTYAYL